MSIKSFTKLQKKKKCQKVYKTLSEKIVKFVSKKIYNTLLRNYTKKLLTYPGLSTSAYAAFSHRNFTLGSTSSYIFISV